MIKLTKQKNKDFVILNLSDPQLGNQEWNPDNIGYKILTRDVEQLVARVKPDLITISGDLSYGGDFEAYKKYADYLDGFGVPWTCCFGNHDNQGGAECMDVTVNDFKQHALFLYEDCDASLGHCNHVIAIEEDGKIATSVIIMDTHDREKFKNENGEEYDVWARLLPNQIDWYRGKVAELKKAGCAESMIITHIPIYAYKEAWAAAVKDGIDPNAVDPQNSTGSAYWKEGYEDSWGVKYEDICSYPAEDNVFAAILEENHTKYYLSGHDHVNNFKIKYKGVNFIYALKTGCGCYWNAKLNGGTVITVGECGIKDVRHEYVDVSDML